MADQIFNEDSRTLRPQAVASQVGLMAVVSVATIVTFNVLRPKNKIIYEPKVKYNLGDKPPPKISSSPFGWLPPLIHTKEPELLDKIGLDAVTFLRFLRLCRWLFTAIALLTCSALVPINYVYNVNNVKAKSRDVLSMLTIRDVKGPYLYAHVASTYGITCIVVAFAYIHWKAMITLRQKYFRTPEYMNTFASRTLAITHVPKKFQSDEGLKAIFTGMQMPYPTTAVNIGRRVGKLPELIDYHNAAVRELEGYLVMYLKGGKIGKSRPTITLGGFMGCGGVKKDAIEFYTAKVQRAEAAIEEYRNTIDTRKAENYGFACMAAVPYAHVVAKLLEGKSGKSTKGTRVALAPNPKDIIWANMNKSDSEIASKKLIGGFWLALVAFFNTVPLFVISVLANLSALTTYVPILETWSSSSPVSFSVVSGVLPPAVSALFGWVLPIIMRKLSEYQGALTNSRLDRAVIARYFSFLVISQLVIFTLIGVIFNSVEQIVLQIGQHQSFQDILNNLHTLPPIINRTYIDQASYWLTFFPLRGFLVLFDLAQIVNLLWTSFRTRVFGRTPRDIREWTQPPEFQYAIYYSNMLFMAAVALVFAPLAPLVVVAAAIVFWISSWVYKYQLMFVFVSKVESGGRLWNVVINRLLACVILMQALMCLTIGLQFKFKSFQWVSTVPPIFIIFAFKIYINRSLSPQFVYFNPSASELAQVNAARSDSKNNSLEKRFGHPALHSELFTPMLHAKMVPLLGQVYRGKIGKGHARLGENGGQKTDAAVVEGIKIAAIDQRDLEYDPQLYRRDHGDQDWDARSMNSTYMLGSDNASLYPGKAGGGSVYEGGGSSLPGYDRYMAASNPYVHSDIELSRMESSNDQDRPLLQAQHQQPYYPEHHPSSQYSQQLYPPQQSNRGPPEMARQWSDAPSYPASMYDSAGGGGEGYREAPVHRGYQPSRQESEYQQQQQQGYGQRRQQQSSSGSTAGFAGRGAHQGGY